MRSIHQRVWLAWLLTGCLVAALGAAEPVRSVLWPAKAGAPVPRLLPDFSRAGYARGERAIPDVAVVANVRDFGAKGDGVSDDTAAFQRALETTTRGAILVPAGRYVITGWLRIERSGVVLRGEGPERSVLVFPKGLDALYPKKGATSTGAPASGYSFEGAFLSIRGDESYIPVTVVSEITPRGATEVLVDVPEGLKVGETIAIVALENPRQTLKTALYDGDPGDISKGKPLEARMLTRIVAIDGRRVRLEDPLRFEARPEWRTSVRRPAVSVGESGIEGLGFEFPATPYEGHFKERGYNALELRKVANCWIRNVRIHNADLAINVMAHTCTVSDVVVTADAARAFAGTDGAGWTGHHALQVKHAEDNLVTRFDLRTTYVHDLSVEHAAGNVFSAGRGVDINFDHHKDTPYQNLFTNIDIGAGRRPWVHGGGAGLGRAAAGWTTFWGIRSAKPIPPPPAEWGVRSILLVGLHTTSPSVMTADRPWFEAIDPAVLQPADLYAAQVAERQRGAKTGPVRR